MTVGDAEKVHDLYAGLVGWRPEAVEMHGRDDSNMTADEDDEPTSAICHSPGITAGRPPQRLIYTAVSVLNVSL